MPNLPTFPLLYFACVAIIAIILIIAAFVSEQQIVAVSNEQFAQQYIKIQNHWNTKKMLDSNSNYKNPNRKALVYEVYLDEKGFIALGSGVGILLTIGWMLI